jgi:hypothetical protein
MIDLRASRLTCQICKKEKKDTRDRRVTNPDYSGPCGDSFCYASCDIDSCVTREFTMLSCEPCAEKYAKQVARQAAKKGKKK